MFRIAFLEPKIPPNTGNAIRLAAVTGCELHLIGPLGFDLADAKLRRAGLDYHDLATTTVHDDLDGAWRSWTANGAARVFAFSGSGTLDHTEPAYRPGDVLLFGTEPTGLPAAVLGDPRVAAVVRIPMIPGRRSLNLSNAAAIVVYEAWRQHDFAGAASAGTSAAPGIES